MPYSQDDEGSFLAAFVNHLEYCEKAGWDNGFQEAYRVDSAHTQDGTYAAGLCAESRLPCHVELDRLRVKPAGTYLLWLNRIDIPSEVLDPGAQDGSPADEGDQAARNPLFAAYDAMQAFARKQGWRLAGDLYDEVLTLYNGSSLRAIYTEVSMLVETGS